MRGRLRKKLQPTLSISGSVRKYYMEHVWEPLNIKDFVIILERVIFQGECNDSYEPYIIERTKLEDGTYQNRVWIGNEMFICNDGDTA